MSGAKFGVIYSRLHQVIPPDEFAHKVEKMGFDAVWATEGLANQLEGVTRVGRKHHRVLVRRCIEETEDVGPTPLDQRA